ncbi:MAG: hypothetical protein ACREYF_11845 [Gammaproteobacteria bacterium]
MIDGRRPELAFAERLCGLLARSGSARLEYISAELQPFCNQQRPDIVFVPRSGGYRGQTIVVEIKLSTAKIQTGRAYQTLVEHSVFAGEALGRPIGRYIYVTKSVVPEFSKRFLAGRGIQILDSVTTEAEVVEWLRTTGVILDE